MEGCPWSTDALLREVNWLRGLSAEVARSHHSAADLEQETWLATLRARPTPRSGLRPWLRAVLGNLALHKSRSDRHRIETERRGARPEALPSGSELAERAELQRLLVERVIALDEPFRQTVLLRFYEGLAPREIAARLGVPPATIRSRLARGLTRLRDDLDRHHRGASEDWLRGLLPLSMDSLPSSKVVAGVLMSKKSLTLVAVLVLCATLWRLQQVDVVTQREVVPSHVATLDVARTRSPADPSHGPAPSTERELLELAPAASSSEADSPNRRLSIIDDHTREPVSFFAVRLHRPGENPFDVQSDEHGVVKVPAEFTNSEFSVEFAENERSVDRLSSRVLGPLASRVRVEPGQTEIEVSVPIGPTFKFALEVPEGQQLTTLTATLRSTDPVRFGDVAYAELRAGQYAWARFRPTARALSTDAPWLLSIVSGDLLWSGSVEVSPRLGLHAAPLRIELERRAKLHGSVRATDGTLLIASTITLSGSEFDRVASRSVSSGASGWYVLGDLRPGRHTLRAQVGGYPDVSTELELAPGETRAFDVVFQSSIVNQPARVVGHVVSASGRFQDALTFTLRSVDAPDVHSRSARVDWSEFHGNIQGTFTFDDVETGAYVLSAPLDGLRSVEPREIALSTADPAPTFVVQDAAPLIAVFFRGINSSSGTALKEVVVVAHVTTENGTTRVECDVEEHLTSIIAPLGAHVRYAVYGSKFRPVYGELVVADGCTPSDPLLVNLEPGWGTELHVVDALGRAVVGARVRLDDTLAGVTSNDGKLRVSASAAPRDVCVEYEALFCANQRRLDEAVRQKRWMDPYLRVELVAPEPTRTR